jgi:hypothetical protein
MRTRSLCKRILQFTALGVALSAPAAASFISNGGFEAGLAGWTTADQVGSDGAFMIQTGASSPGNLLSVPAPPEGSNAAMTDAAGPGSHVMYQDFAIPSVFPGAFVAFSLYIGNRADRFAVPDPESLDFSTPALNQQARVDILMPTADPFSIAAGDVLMNLFQTDAGDPLVSGYKRYVTDVSALFQAHAGQTLRLRFAEVDNIEIFNFGVDNVRADVIPEPGTWVLTITAFVAFAIRRTRR